MKTPDTHGQEDIYIRTKHALKVQKNYYKI